jgi:hypothetical protein
MVRFVRGNIFGGDHRIKRFGQPPLCERDEVSVAVRQQCELPAVCVKRSKGRANVGKNGPVWDRRRQRSSVVVLEVERELRRRAAQGFGEHDSIAPKRLLLLDLTFQLDVSVEHVRAAAREKQLPGRLNPVAPVYERPEAVERQPPGRHRRQRPGAL